jgi:Tfp pilus assembly protein PilF
LVVALLPVSNIVPVYYFVQDRYAFIPSVGLAVAAACLALAARRSSRGAELAVAGTALVIAALFAVASVRLASVWRQSRTLWENAVKHHPRSYFAHLGLGHTLRDEGQLDAAIRQYRAAIRLQPGFAPARLSYCVASALRHGEASAEKTEHSLRRAWNQPKALVRLSATWLRTGNAVCASVAESRAFALMRPTAADLIAAASRWVVAGQGAQASRHLRRAAGGRERAAWHEVMAQVLVLEGDVAKARKHMARSLAKAPRDGDTLQRAAAAFAKLGRTELADFYRSLARPR